MRSRYDVLVLYDMPATLSAAGRANLQAFAESGKGIVVMHHALCSHNDWDGTAISSAPAIRSSAGRPSRVQLQARRDDPHRIAHPHPITRGVTLTEIYDETYKGMWISPQNTVLLTRTHPLADPPLAWISGYARSRVVAIEPGHGREAHLHPAYRALVRNAIRGRAAGCSDGLQHATQCGLGVNRSGDEPRGEAMPGLARPDQHGPSLGPDQQRDRAPQGDRVDAAVGPAVVDG